MFNSFSKLKIGLKIVLGILFVEVISLISGVTMGKNITSHMVVLGCLSTVVISQYIAWWVSENISKSVTNVLTDLSQTSDNLTSLSKGLTVNSHKLAEGSSEQAASIQETSSTLEESSSMVHQTTQNTKEAEILARKAKEAADKGNSEMGVMLDAMQELKRSSGEISKIIKVIDEIAFQTNILSLNAAVEAARAGDAGKGFAVVAEEVRNLAQRSAQAAKDTATIIESNIDLSEKCLAITDQVNNSLSEITDESSKVSELLSEISTASQEQEIGISQINQAISQMEHVLQGNASTAQETATSADALGSCSETVKGIMQSLSNLIYGVGKIHSNVTKGLFPRKPATKVHSVGKSEPVKKIEASKSSFKPSKPDVAKDTHIVAAAPAVKTEASVKSLSPEDIIPLDDF